MGNTLNGASLYRDDMNFPYHVQLGSHAFIDVIKTKDDEDDELPNETQVIYTVGRSTMCVLEFKRSFGIVCNTASFTLIEEDKGSCVKVDFTITKAKTEHIETFDIPFCSIGEFTCWIWTKDVNRIINAWGVTESTVFVYGKGRRMGLVVVESKKKNNDKKAYMVTVAHYFALDDGNVSNQTMDIGLSVVVKIQASNEVGLKFTIEGPKIHPSAALFYMFDEVKKSGVWKPNLCPHCANIQKQRARVSWQTSDSEDNENLSSRQSSQSRMNSGSVVANDAPIKGNYNGSLFVRRLFFR